MYKVAKQSTFTGDHFRLLKNARAEKKRLGREYHIYVSENQGNPNKYYWIQI